jgi:AraC family transcriptional regulator of arabinose operon
LGGAFRDEIINLDLMSLLAKLSHFQQRANLPEKTVRYFSQFSELRSELYNSPQTHVSVDELAVSVNLSKSYFQHIYKELFGCSVVWDMIHGRLEYAKYLLDNTTLSISAISQMCGYENYTHFIRQFKKFLGMTPGHYRTKQI